MHIVHKYKVKHYRVLLRNLCCADTPTSQTKSKHAYWPLHISRLYGSFLLLNTVTISHILPKSRLGEAVELTGKSYFDIIIDLYAG